MKKEHSIKAIIGLGNPGAQFDYTRHNIGFMVLDALADTYQGNWRTKGDMVYADVMMHDHKLMLIKPQTFMNESGRIMNELKKKGIEVNEIIVVHDELEKPFGDVSVKHGGGHRGHNGLRSIMHHSGPDFIRIPCGIGRPEHKEQVGDYVLSTFSETPDQVENMIDQAVIAIEKLISNDKEL
jgi:PTH1 family peptidyl-tRNA hydrolase